jgi:predicted DNA-binding protein
MSEVKRTTSFRLSDEDRSKLDQLAQERSKKVSNIIREMIWREFHNATRNKKQ